MNISIGTKASIGGKSREQQAGEKEAARQAQIQAQKQAELNKITAENLRKQREREAALRLQSEKTRNEAEKTRNEAALSKQQQQQSSGTTDQREREKMVRTVQTRRRGRASLRINLGSYGSSYEGSSGISINL